MRLLLFDVDKTLLDAGGLGPVAMNKIFFDMFQVRDAFAGIMMHGKTDPLIFRAVANETGVGWSQEKEEIFRSGYAAEFAKLIEQDGKGSRALPGAKALLEHLQPMTDQRLGLLTGNWSEGARAKLHSAGLSGFFGSVGAYADDGPQRSMLFPAALERCRKHTGWFVRPKDVVIIGDTPRDVAVATEHGASCLGVATGPYSTDELKDAGADMVVDDLTDTEAVYDFLLNGQQEGL